MQFHSTLYFVLRLCSLFKKALMRILAFLHKWLATSPQWTACNQLTINTPFHSLRGERALPYFVLEGRTKHQWPSQNWGHNICPAIDRKCKVYFSLAMTVLSPLSLFAKLLDVSLIWTKSHTFPQVISNLATGSPAETLIKVKKEN